MLILSRPSKFRFQFSAIDVSVEVERAAWCEKATLLPSAISIELAGQNLLSALDEDYSGEAMIGDLEMRSHELRNIVSSISMVFHLFVKQFGENAEMSRPLLEKWLLQLQELNDLVDRSHGDSDYFNQLLNQTCQKGLVLGMESGHLYQSHRNEGRSMVLVADDDARQVLEKLDWTPDFAVGSFPE